MMSTMMKMADENGDVSTNDDDDDNESNESRGGDGDI